MNLNIIVHKNEPKEPSVFTITHREGKKQEPQIFTIEENKEVNTISIPVKYAEKKETDQISIPVKYAEKDNNYEEILSMLESIRDNQKMLQYIKSFIKAVIKRYR